MSSLDSGASSAADAATTTSPAASVKGALIEGFDGIVCDLDGVVYRGSRAVPHAVQSLLSALSAGTRVVYATNNASRAPAEVAAHLAELGLPGPASRVVTSAQAGAHLVAQRCRPGARVLAVGGPGVALALAQAGLTPVPVQARADGPVVAVLQGYGAEVSWADLAEVAYAVQAGALWVATNVDRTLPTERGVAPGNGALVGAVRSAVGVDPVVVGKPCTPLFDLSIVALGSTIERTLVIGDRLDTDVLGAATAGMASLFVLGGVHGWVDLAGADPAVRPTYVATDLRSLHSTYADAVPDLEDRSRWICGEAQAWVSSGDLVVSRAGALNDRLRAALRAAWHARDVGGAPIDPRGGDGSALSDELDKAVAQGRQDGGGDGQ